MSERFTYFYGGVFSNWYLIKFKVDGVTYCSSEHYMMAEKARYFNDPKAEAAVMGTKSASKAKQIGRDVKGFNKERWAAVVRDKVYKGCYAKFQQHPRLLKELLATEGTTLVEASPTDQIWGIGLDVSDSRAQQRETWRGTNWLGEVLTLVREDLKAGIYRTDNFCWSDTKPPNAMVTIINNSSNQLDMWTHDVMRRKAYDLLHDYASLNIKKVDVIVRESANVGYFELGLSVILPDCGIGTDGYMPYGDQCDGDECFLALDEALTRMRLTLDKEKNETS